MELARHSDMRLTMKTYTDVGQLPLAATVRGLPSIGDSQIDSQTLVADRPAVSPSVIGVKAIKVGRAIDNIDESRSLTPVVALCHSERPSGDMGFESPSLRQFLFREISPQAACFGIGAELNSANRFHGFLNSTANDFSAI
jgi:hypothetical protein